jgi:hypothetical protein
MKGILLSNYSCSKISLTCEHELCMNTKLCQFSRASNHRVNPLENMGDYMCLIVGEIGIWATAELTVWRLSYRLALDRFG